MEMASMIGMDLAKNSFQLHDAGADGSVAFRKKLSRSKVLTFLGNQAPCVVAMEACAGAHDWGRRIQKLGHEAFIGSVANLAKGRCVTRGTAHLMILHWPNSPVATPRP